MSRSVRLGLAVFLIASAGAGSSSAAEPSANRPPATKAPASASTSRPPARSGTAKGPLPDPTLLDGAKQPADKRPEHGMVGDFELPGDENVREGKVGGAQGQNPGMPAGMPQGGGAPGQQGGQQAQQGGQQGQQGGAAEPTPSPQAAGGANEGAPGEAEGKQVAGLTGAGGDPKQLPKGEKPQGVAIGDPAMRIETPANQPNVVGSQVPATTAQHHEKGTGTGGKSATGNNSNKGVERGRTMPSGL